MNQITPNPTTAATKPPLRNTDGGISMAWAIMRYMASGKRAYKAPSITNTRANAVNRSDKAAPPDVPAWAGFTS